MVPAANAHAKIISGDGCSIYYNLVVRCIGLTSQSLAMQNPGLQNYEDLVNRRRLTALDLRKCQRWNVKHEGVLQKKFKLEELSMSA